MPFDGPLYPQHTAVTQGLVGGDASSGSAGHWHHQAQPEAVPEPHFLTWRPSSSYDSGEAQATSDSASPGTGTGKGTRACAGTGLSHLAAHSHRSASGLPAAPHPDALPRHASAVLSIGSLNGSSADASGAGTDTGLPLPVRATGTGGSAHVNIF